MKRFVIVVAMALFAAPVCAETYIWVDDQGTVNFTENPGNIPKKYRKKARIVGEEEPPAAAAPEEKESPAVRPPAERTPGEAPQGEREGAPAAKQEQNAVYGGKDANAWKTEFVSLRADLKAAERQLVEQRERVKDVSAMSRQEYLAIQNTIKAIEYNVLGLRKKLGELKQEAERAGVPAELME